MLKKLKTACKLQSTLKIHVFKLVLLNFLIFLSWTVHSQEWTYNTGNKNSGVMPGIIVSNDVIQYFEKGLTSPGCQLNQFDMQTGQVKSSATLYGDLLSACKTKQKGWYLLFGAKSCDTYDKMQVLEFDSLQNIVNSHTLNTHYNAIPLAFPDCYSFTNTNNQCWIVTPWYLYIVDDQSNQVQIKSRQFKKYGASIPLPNSKILQCGRNSGSPHIYKISSTAVIEDSIPCPALFTHLVQTPNNQWFGISENGLYKMDSTFHTLQFHSFSGTVQPVGLKLENDTLYTVVNSSSGSNYMQFSTSLSCILNQFNSHKGVKVRDFELLSNHRIVFISTIATHDEKNEACLTVRDRTTGNTLDMDIRLDKVQLINCKETEAKSGLSTNFYTSITPIITATNLSPYPLKSFYFNIKLYVSSFCAPLFNTDTIYTEMRPFETRSFALKEQTFITNVSVLSKFQICGFLSLPNNKSDKYLQNDRLCSNKDENILSIENSSMINTTAYYNSNLQKMVITKLLPISEIKLMDITGRVLKIMNSSDENMSIPMHELPAGIYILQIQEKGSNKVIKFCKEN